MNRPVSISEIFEIFLRHRDITTDSRNVRKGSVYFALKGERFDGNRFAEEALEKGASYAVVDDPALSDRRGCLLVSDALLALQELAGMYRKRFDIPVIGLTGSNGKTTTKELIQAVLGIRYRVAATQGNFNNHIGVPLTVLRWKEDTEMAVVEMGANHPGEIRQLCELARPTHGIITNIGKAHLEGFGSLENVRRAKKEMYDWLEDHGGMVFRNSLETSLATLPFPSGRLITYGGAADQVTGELVSADPFLAIRIHIRDNEGKVGTLSLNTRLAGSYNFHNVLTAVQVGLFFGVAQEGIGRAIESVEPANHRSQIIQLGKCRLFFDAYNANPTSMMLALKDFFGMKAEEKTVILGDMLELGETEDDEHMKIIEFLQAQQIRRVLLAGPVFSRVNPVAEYRTFPDTESMIAWLRDNPLPPSFVFVKGSRGMHLEKVKACFESITV